MDKEHESHRKHGKRHDGWDGSMAASTDIADLHGDAGESARNGAEHEHEKKQSRAHAPKDVHTWIKSPHILAPDQCRLGLQLTEEQSQTLRDGTAGYLMSAEGPLAIFTITIEPETHTAWAVVEMSMQQALAQTIDVVLNPSSIPKPAVPKDAYVQVVDVVGQGDRSRVLISIGRTRGAEVGMQGYLMAGGVYIPGTTFRIVEVHPRTSVAYINMRSSEVAKHLDAVVNASNMPAPVERHDFEM